MERNFIIEENRMTYFMPVEIDHHSARIIARQIDGMVEGKGIRIVTMDFGRTEFMDSSGVGVIIGRSRKLKFFEGHLLAQNMSERVEKLFRTAGLHKIVEVKSVNE